MGQSRILKAQIKLIQELDVYGHSGLDSGGLRTFSVDERKVEVNREWRRSDCLAKAFMGFR